MEPIEPAGHGRLSADLDVLAGLNPAQREAVSHPGGPLLVLAGAGSGKTRVITHRIAHLIIDRHVPPTNVVAVTFTNKAAGEMRERVEAMLGASRLGAWIGTFHALCLRLLRREGERVGLNPGFNVYDADDQVALVKRILKEELEEGDEGRPRTFRSRISRAKNALQSPDELQRRAFTRDQELTARVYRRYEEALAQANAADFDDLLLRAVRLLGEHPDLREFYASHCQHLLVDEYQDTNRPQYLLVRALSSIHGNVTVVGDEDQCIYRFRGAELRNILDFETDHPGTRAIRLEQNYRSTSTILAAAGAVVDRNSQRLGKRLWTENGGGEPVELCRAPDDRSEAAWVASRMRQLEAETPYDGMAVLYRTNAQSRLLEELLRRERIPYQIVGSIQFYARKEIRDLLAYLKLAINPVDDVAFRRVVNTPARGVGNTTLEAVERLATERGLPLLAAARDAVGQGLLAARSARRLGEFVTLIDELTTRTASDSVPALLERAIEATRYADHLQKTYGMLASERLENVRSLVSAAVEYTEESAENEEALLSGFLDRSALVADADEVGQTPGVTLMTVHCAKGLEFPIVFLIGLEEKLFPHMMAMDSDEDVEEERRLCYVAMTRARERLLLAHARLRRLQGNLLPTRPSRFLDEIPRPLIREIALDGGVVLDDPWGVRGPSERYADGGGSSAARELARRRQEQRVVTPTLASAPAPRGSAADPDDGYRVGSFVKHPRFGAGRILDREGAGKNLKLVIRFDDGATKKILPSYTRLQVEVG